VIGSSLDIPLTTVDRADEDDGVAEEDANANNEVDEDGANADDEVDEEGPTGRARMCCRSKPTGEQRQATRGAGRLPGRLVGPGPSVNGPAIWRTPWLGVTRRAT
jgi:hypothetical protein